MKWEKKGLVYGPSATSGWAVHSALQPTPYLLNPDVLRIFVGFRDSAGVGRVGFVDVRAADPSDILEVSHSPALDVGIPGAFDDNGVIPCAVVEREEGLFLYYAGYQISTKIKFFGFSGLAISRDRGRTFQRFSQVPVLDRTDEEMFFRAAHTVLYDNGIWRVWYGGGSRFIREDGKLLPVYDVRYMESADGITFPRTGSTCVTFADPEEYRIGRPFVVRHGDRYRMFYGVARRGQGYRLGYAESHDGTRWVRKDEEVGLEISSNDWDAGMIAYPSLISCGGQTYLFYNGNEMGRDGFGYAVLREW